jgi:transcriptional regulator with XRE-family HTH domain
MGTWTGDAVKALRLRLKLHQGAFGELVGVSRQAVHEWESGKTAVSDLNGEALSRVAREQERKANPPPLPEVLRRAQEETAMNLTRLQEIRAHCKFLHEELLHLAERQGRVVAALDPWAGLEESAEEQLRLRALATLQTAQVLDPAPSAKKPARPKRRGRA